MTQSTNRDQQLVATAIAWANGDLKKLKLGNGLSFRCQAHTYKVADK